MTVLEYVENEINTNLRSEIEKTFNGKEREDLLNKLDAIHIDLNLDDLDTLLNVFFIEIQFSILNYIKEIECINPDLENEQIATRNLVEEIEESLKAHPKNRLLPLFWLMYKIGSLNNYGSNSEDGSAFLDTVFYKYRYLVKLDDFFNFTGILGRDFTHYMKDNKMFIELLEKFIPDYHEKMILKLTLGNLFFKNHEHKEAFNVFNYILDKYEVKEDDWDGVVDDDITYMMQNIAIIHFENQKYDEAKVCADYVIDNLPAIHDCQGVLANIGDCMDSFLIRMHINILQSNLDLVKADYVIIKIIFRRKEDDIDTHIDYEPLYPEVFEFVDNNIKLLDINHL